VPAIQPARLKQQASEIAEHFDDPDALVRSLHNLLDYYSDRAIRPGLSGTPVPLIDSYNVRPPVLKQLVQELTPLVQDNPEQGLALCDRLWDEPYYEFRSLAASLLGKIPPDPAERIVDRIQTWLTTDLDAALVEALLVQALAQLRERDHQTHADLIQGWLDSGDDFHTQMGLRALIQLIQEPDFENLPVFYKLIQTLTRACPPAVKPDLLDILTMLAHYSPSETAYFLRRTLDTPEAVDTPWIIRQILSEFPPEIEASLRKVVRETKFSA
jgi:hypothetical protein